MVRHDDAHKIRKGREVLRLLADLGMLSTRTITQFLEYGPRDLKLRQTMRRLVRRNLVRQSGRGAGAGRELHFQLAQNEQALETSSRLLGVSVDALWQGNRRASDAHHEDECGRFHHFLRTHYPNSKVYRPWQYLRDESLANISFQKSESVHLWPDLMFVANPLDLGTSTAAHSQEIYIAVEIENLIKSRARFVEKALGIGNYSAFDAVLYLLPRVHWEPTLYEMYSASAVPEMFRVQHYAKTFLATGFYGDANKDVGQLPILHQDTINTFHDWCSYLSKTALKNRRNM